MKVFTPLSAGKLRSPPKTETIPTRNKYMYPETLLFRKLTPISVVQVSIKGSFVWCFNNLIKNLQARQCHEACKSFLQ